MADSDIQLKNRTSLADIEASLEIDDIYFPQVADRSWLACKPFPVGSVFGLAYENETTGDEIEYSLQVRKLVLDASQENLDPSTYHKGPAPVVPTYPLQIVGSEDSTEKKYYTSNDQIIWYDLTAYPKDLAWTSKRILRLLQNLLGVSHSASPWSPFEAHDESACVVFFFDSKGLEEKLIDFRISDACPSWCRFSEAKLSSLPEFYDESILHSNAMDQDTTISESRSFSMFVFRHLPQRARISILHPISQQPPPHDGCLWETIKNKATDSWIHRSVAPPYFDARADLFSSMPNLHSLLEEPNISVLKKESLSFSSTSWTPWPEEAHYATKPNGAAPWRVVPLLHCFPATDASRRRWIPNLCELCPGTVRILKECIGETNLRTALWSRLDPDSVLEAHTGWADLANHVLRVHIPVVVPVAGVCGTWVDGCVAESSKIVIFDDSKTHRAFNYSETEERIVLIVDIVRPTQLPPGTATGGHSDELDSFIQHFSKVR